MPRPNAKGPESLDFNIDGPQTYYCSWRNAERTMRYVGVCASCRKRVYGFDDGANDPRGPAGDATANILEASDYNKKGEDVIGCAACFNHEAGYNVLVEAGMSKWK